MGEDKQIIALKSIYLYKLEISNGINELIIPKLFM